MNVFGWFNKRITERMKWYDMALTLMLVKFLPVLISLGWDRYAGMCAIAAIVPIVRFYKWW